MRNGFTIRWGAALLLALAGCNEKDAAGRGGLSVVTEDVSGAIDRLSAEENARSRVTMVDAATGDAAAMPAEWTGPTAYDLRETEAERDADGPATADAPKTPQTAPRLTMKSVAEETFPSVAE